MKQTAVEWLVEQLNIKYGNNDFIVTHINEIEQAKEMEKEQIIEAFIDGDVSKFNEYAEQYYLKTYKQD